MDSAGFKKGDRVKYISDHPTLFGRVGKVSEVFPNGVALIRWETTNPSDPTLTGATVQDLTKLS